MFGHGYFGSGYFSTGFFGPDDGASGTFLVVADSGSAVDTVQVNFGSAQGSEYWGGGYFGKMYFNGGYFGLAGGDKSIVISDAGGLFSESFPSFTASFSLSDSGAGDDSTSPTSVGVYIPLSDLIHADEDFGSGIEASLVLLDLISSSEGLGASFEDQKVVVDFGSGTDLVSVEVYLAFGENVFVIDGVSGSLSDAIQILDQAGAIEIVSVQGELRSVIVFKAFKKPKISFDLS